MTCYGSMVCSETYAILQCDSLVMALSCLVLLAESYLCLLNASFNV